MAALLLLAALAPAEEWKPLWKEWKAALSRYDQAAKQAPSVAVRARLRHPIGKFRDRFRTFAIENAGFPRAAPALIELLRHTNRTEEQLWVMIQLRETHLRSKHLWRVVPALIRIPGKESLRTLREIAEGSPHERCARDARLGVYERTTLAVGKPAPNIGGRDKQGRSLTLRRFKGEPFLLVLGDAGREGELKALGVRILGVGNDWPGWAKEEQLLRRFNALDRPRIFVIDKAGVIAAKDPNAKRLKEVLSRLK